MITQKEEWEVTAKRFVAYIDIMGFKDMVAKESPYEIHKMLKEVIELTKNAQKAQLFETVQVRFNSYSDSIMIYSKDDSFESLFSIIFNISTITNSLLVQGVPHKGALAFGNMTLDFKNSIFFGQPLIDAYLLQNELLFYGILVHATAEERIELDYNGEKSYAIKKSIKEYDCPLKKGNSFHLTIFPMYALLNDPKFQAGTVRILESMKKFRFKTSGHLRKYIDNTNKYLNIPTSP